MQILTSAQCRAARALLNWSQSDLAERSGVHIQTISNFEKDTKIPSPKTLIALSGTFAFEQIDFIDNGIRKRDDLIRVIEGDDCYIRMLDEAESILSSKKGEILFSASDERRTPPNILDKLRALRRSGIRFRSLVRNGDTFLMGPIDEYRWMKEGLFVESDVKIIYGDCVAYLMTWRGIKKIFIFKESRIAEEQRRLFDYVWDSSLRPMNSTSKTKYDLMDNKK